MIQASHRCMLLLGWTSTIGQVVLFREAMACLAGSELSWGLVLGMWLASVSLGARLGSHHELPRLGLAAPPLIVALSFIGAITLRVSPGLVGSGSGEVIGLGQGLLLWLVAITPAALVSGMAFPAIAAPIRKAGTAYAVEALGALAGGLAFSALLAPLGSTITLAVTLALTIVLLPSRHGACPRILLAAALVAAGVASSGPLLRFTWRFTGHPGELADWHDSRQQRLELATGDPSALYGNGALLAWYPEDYLAPTRSHLAMLLHERPHKVFAFGALADGSFGSMLLHPIDSLILVENDPALFRVLPRWYGGEFASLLRDPRVSLRDTDPLVALKSSPPLDLIILFGELPSSLRLNRTYTTEFLKTCSDRLRPGGVLVMGVALDDTYLGGAAGDLLAVLSSTICGVFPNLTAIPGSPILLAASHQKGGVEIAAPVLQERWRARAVHAPVMNASLIPALLDATRSAQLTAFTRQQRARPNTARAPSAILPATAVSEGLDSRAALRASLWLSRVNPWWMVAVVAFAATAVLSASTRPGALGPVLAATAGASSMSWWLLLIATWQGSRGSVYAEIGLLNGLFMAGLAGGSLVAAGRRLGACGLPTIFVLGAAISVCIASALPAGAALVLVPLLMTAAGGLTGAAFPFLARLCAAHPGRSAAGIAFAADELGAAAAALVVGMIALPLAGAAGCGAGLAVILLAAAWAARTTM